MTRYRQYTLLYFLIAIFGCGRAACQPTAVATGLSEPHHKASVPAMNRGGWKYWDKGYLVTWAWDGANYDVSPGKTAVTLYDHNGNPKNADFWLEGASRVGVHHAATTQAGKIIISGGARTEDGKAVFYIAEIGDGGEKRIIRTSPFAPVYICGGTEDTVWAYGFERDEEGNGVSSGPMLRQFSFEKGQIKAMLLLNELAPGWDLPEGKYLGEVNFRCNANSVIVYSAHSSQLVRFDVKNSTLKIINVDPLPPPSKLRITGFAFTDSGDVFVSFHDRAHSQPMSGLFQLTFDAASNGKWVAVPGTVGLYRRGSPIEKLLGADGDSLVHTRDVDGNIHWSKYNKQ
jgi:hypothetical protein